MVAAWNKNNRCKARQNFFCVGILLIGLSASLRLARLNASFSNQFLMTDVMSLISKPLWHSSDTTKHLLWLFLFSVNQGISEDSGSSCTRPSREEVDRARVRMKDEGRPGEAKTHPASLALLRPLTLNLFRRAIKSLEPAANVERHTHEHERCK